MGRAAYGILIAGNRCRERVVELFRNDERFEGKGIVFRDKLKDGESVEGWYCLDIDDYCGKYLDRDNNHPPVEDVRKISYRT